MIEKFLIKNGYSNFNQDPVFRDNCKYAYKNLIDDKQIFVKSWDMKKHNMPTSFDVECIFETKNEIWKNIKYYGLSEKNLIENLSRLESILKQEVIMDTRNDPTDGNRGVVDERTNTI